MVRGDAWEPQEKLRVLWTLLVHVRRFMILNRWSPRAALVVVRGIAHGVATPAHDDPQAGPAVRRTLEPRP